MEFITNNSYCFKFDLHLAYHHVDIFKPRTDYLGFSWCFGNTVKYSKFVVLPFGLSSACYIFTKLTHPLAKKWRGDGKQITMYLDDGIGVHIDLQVCSTLSDAVRHDLILSGFVPKKEKYMWSPVQQLTILGYFIDTEIHFISIPEERPLKVFKTINLIEYKLETISKVPARLAASLVGQIVSVSYVIGNVTNIMTKYLSIDILDKQSLNSAICLSKESLDQIAFWKRNLRSANLKEFTFDLSCHTIVYSDASNTGYGGYMVENPNDIAHGMWSNNESMKM
jgi:hypothetical protein